MKVEEQLIKGNYDNQKHRLRVNLLHSHYWLVDQIAVFLKPYGITQQQFNILRILRGKLGEPISTKELRERMIVGNSDTSRLLDRLIEKDLAWKRPRRIDLLHRFRITLFVDQRVSLFIQHGGDR